MTRIGSLLPLIFAVGLLAGGTGCTAVYHLVNGIPTDDEVKRIVDDAYAKEDEKTLTDLCSDRGAKTFKKRLPRKSAYACKRRKALANAQANRAVDTMIAGDCAAIPALYEQVPFQRKRVAQEKLNALGLKLAECKHWPLLFDRIGYRSRNTMLETVRGKNGAIETELITHLYSSMDADDKRLSGHVASSMEKWLKTHGAAAQCPLLSKVVDYERGFGWEAARFYERHKCAREGVKLAEALIKDDHGPNRAQGCYTLGKLGNARHLKTLGILATTDGYLKKREVTRGSTTAIVANYPVRDACREASGKIRMRK
jgi:hypothetical protein